MTDSTAKAFVIVSNSMSLGGIQTLVVKIANALAKRGAAVIVNADRGALADRLDPRVSRFAHSNYVEYLRGFARERADALIGKDVTIISLDPWALVVSHVLNRQLRRRGVKTIRVFHLVTHARDFFKETRFPFVLRLWRSAFSLAPSTSTYFMNEASRRSHEEFWGVDLSGHPVVTLPLADCNTAWEGPVEGVVSIISVGRLVAFKGYNRAAPTIIASLRSKGIDARWDIWGDGEDEPSIRAQIDQLGLAAHVRLMGPLDYDLFDKTVAASSLFVGMGTALLEAACMGVPSVTAIEATTNQCYGYLDQTPLDSIGDKVLGVPTLDLEDVILSYAEASAAQKAAIGRGCKAAAESRSSSVSNVCDAMSNTPTFDADKEISSRWIRLAESTMWARSFYIAFLSRRGGSSRHG